MYLSLEQLKKYPFRRLGTGVLISDKASIYGAENIEIGSNVRIDDFCVLSAGKGGISIGRNVHLAVYTSIIGKERVSLGDFCNLSSRVTIYSSTDDFGGSSMTNPTIPETYTNVMSAPVDIQDHSIVGTGSVILPGVHISKGVAIGAISVVKTDCEYLGIYAGIPAKRIGGRRDDIFSLEAEYLNECKTDSKGDNQ